MTHEPFTGFLQGNIAAQRDQQSAPRQKPRTLVAIEGIDGSGKTTLAHNLAARLEARTISFPGRNPASPIARLIDEALHSEKHDIGDIPAAMSLLFALDRASRRRDLETPGLTIVDRYAASSAAYTSARRGRASDRKWIGMMEFNHLGLPQPDLHILIDLPVEDAQQRLGNRRTADTYEADLALQQHVAHNYRDMAKERWRSPWAVIDGTLPPDEVEERAVNAIDRHLTGGRR